MRSSLQVSVVVDTPLVIFPVCASRCDAGAGSCEGQCTAAVHWRSQSSLAMAVTDGPVCCSISDNVGVRTCRRCLPPWRATLLPAKWLCRYSCSRQLLAAAPSCTFGGGLLQIQLAAHQALQPTNSSMHCVTHALHLVAVPVASPAAGCEGCWCVAAGSVQGQEGEAPFLSCQTAPQGHSSSCSTQLCVCTGDAAAAGCYRSSCRSLHMLQHHHTGTLWWHLD